MAEFKTEDVKQQYEEKISKIESVLNAPVVDKKYLWNETVKNYATKIKQISRVLKPQNFSNKPIIGNSDEKISDKLEIDADIFKELENFLQTCEKKEFQIALVGTIKAGKSTLINALLDYEFASTDITPETAALTKFRKADEDYLEITFYKKDDFDDLYKSAKNPNKDFQENNVENIDNSNSVFIDEYNKSKADTEKDKWLDREPEKISCNDKEDLKQKIAEATSSKYAKHYFVKEVTVGLKGCNLPRDVVLVDTPGLNDVVEYRSEITRKYISNANAVFACIKSDKFEGNGGIYETLIRIFENSREKPEKIYVLATQLDALQHPEEDWKKQEEKWITYLKDKLFYGDAALAKKNLIPVSAWLYTLLQDYKKILADYNKNLDKKDKRRERFFDLRNTVGKWGFDESEISEEKNFKELQDAARIKVLETTLEKELLPKRDEYLLSDIKTRYEKCCESIRKSIKNTKQIQQEMFETSQKSIEEIRTKRQEKEIELKKAEDDKKKLSETIEKLRKLAKERIDEVKKKIKDISAKGKGGE